MFADSRPVVFGEILCKHFNKYSANKRTMKFTLKYNSIPDGVKDLMTLKTLQDLLIKILGLWAVLHLKLT